MIYHFKIFKSWLHSKIKEPSDILDLSFEENLFVSSAVKINDLTAVCKTLNYQMWRKKKTHFGSRLRRPADGQNLESVEASAQSPE